MPILRRPILQQPMVHDLMPLEYQYFLAWLIAHTLGDFPFQTAAMVNGKIAGSFRALLSHLAVHLTLAVAITSLFIGAQAANWNTALALLVLITGHGLLDIGKSRLIGSRPALDGTALYVTDQLIHVAIIFGAVAIAVPRADFILPAVSELWGSRASLLLPVAILLLTVFPTGYLIRYLLTPLGKELLTGDPDEKAAVDSDADLVGLSNAGLYLGWLERTLLTLAVATGSVSAVGLILGAKAVARYPEFRSRAFAEYFLIGTLLSVLFAIAGGSMLRWLWDQQIPLA